MTFRLSLRAKADGILVAAAFGGKDFGDDFLLLCVCHAYFGALVVFRKTVLTAELASTIGTLERKESLLTAFLTVHESYDSFLSLVSRFGLYLSPKPTTIVDSFLATMLKGACSDNL